MHRATELRLARMRRSAGAWLGRRGPVLLAAVGMACFTAAGLTVSLTVGLVTAGVSFLIMERRAAGG